MAQLLRWRGPEAPREGRLPEASSAALDALCTLLTALGAPGPLSPATTEVLLSGFQAAHRAVRGEEPGGAGWWTFRLERLSPLGGSLLLRRDPSPDSAAPQIAVPQIGFEITQENRLHGFFYIELPPPDVNSPQAEPQTGAVGRETDGAMQAPEQAGDRSLDYAFDLVRGDTRWVLRGWDADEPTLYAFEAPRDLPYWDPAPELDLWDQVVPTGGTGLLGWLDGIVTAGRGKAE